MSKSLCITIILVFIALGAVAGYNFSISSPSFFSISRTLEKAHLKNTEERASIADRYPNLRKGGVIVSINHKEQFLIISHLDNYTLPRVLEQRRFHFNSKSVIVMRRDYLKNNGVVYAVRAPAMSTIEELQEGDKVYIKYQLGNKFVATHITHGTPFPLPQL